MASPAIIACFPSCIRFSDLVHVFQSFRPISFRFVTPPLRFISGPFPHRYVIFTIKTIHRPFHRGHYCLLQLCAAADGKFHTAAPARCGATWSWAFLPQHEFSGFKFYHVGSGVGPLYLVGICIRVRDTFCMKNLKNGILGSWAPLPLTYSINYPLNSE